MKVSSEYSTDNDDYLKDWYKLSDEQINLLRNLLTNHFPPSNEQEIAELIEVSDSIIGALNVPLHARITVPLLPYRQHGFVRRQTRTQGDALGQGRKRKTRRAKRRN